MGEAAPSSGLSVQKAASSTGLSQTHPPKKDGWPEVPAFAEPSPFLRSAALAIGAEKRRCLREGYVSEGPSESSVNIEDTEDENLQSALPGLERFYETMAAKAQIKPGAGSSSSWVLSMARSYRRLSKEKRRRGRLKELLQPAVNAGVLRSASGGSLVCPGEHLGWSSNTDDSGYEAGYETDADESELSEWEGSVRQGHKRKLEALVNLTKQMTFATELPGGQAHEEPLPFGESARQPPPKTLRALGTRPVGLRLSLPNGSGSDTLQARSCQAPPEAKSVPLDGPPGPSLPALPAPVQATGSDCGVARATPHLSLQQHELCLRGWRAQAAQYAWHPVEGAARRGQRGHGGWMKWRIAHAPFVALFTCSTCSETVQKSN